jgi:hypothetical protein
VECSEGEKKLSAAVLDLASYGNTRHFENSASKSETTERLTTAPHDERSHRKTMRLYYTSFWMVAALAAICIFLTTSVLIANKVMKRYCHNSQLEIHENLIV